MAFTNAERQRIYRARRALATGKPIKDRDRELLRLADGAGSAAPTPRPEAAPPVAAHPEAAPPEAAPPEARAPVPAEPETEVKIPDAVYEPGATPADPTTPAPRPKFLSDLSSTALAHMILSGIGLAVAVRRTDRLFVPPTDAEVKRLAEPLARLMPKYVPEALEYDLEMAAAGAGISYFSRASTSGEGTPLQ